MKIHKGGRLFGESCLREKGEVLGTVEVVEGPNNATNYTVEEGTNPKKRLRKSNWKKNGSDRKTGRCAKRTDQQTIRAFINRSL